LAVLPRAIADEGVRVAAVRVRTTRGCSCAAACASAADPAVRRARGHRPLDHHDSVRAHAHAQLVMSAAACGTGAPADARQLRSATRRIPRTAAVSAVRMVADSPVGAVATTRAAGVSPRPAARRREEVVVSGPPPFGGCGSWGQQRLVPWSVPTRRAGNVVAVDGGRDPRPAGWC